MKFLIERTSHKEMGSAEPPAPGSVRTAKGDAWQIELSTFDDLSNLIDTLEEPLILSRRQGPSGLTSIEIYDDLRE
jgi:hypothetical protein